MHLVKNRYRRLWPALVTAAMFVVLVACGQEATLVPTATAVPPTPEPVVTSINVGVGDGTVSGNVFTPNAVTIPAGTTLEFTITSDEVHSVTFMGEGPPPEGAPTSWPRTLSADVGTVDGAGFINTGLIPRGTVVSAQFPTAGSYTAICIIHPGMVLEVTVVEPGQAYTSASQAKSLSQQQAEAVLAEVDALRQGALDSFSSTQQPDGTTLWEVQVGALTQTSTGPLELLEYLPPEITIKAGDTILWTADTPHSVTFGSAGEDLPPGPPTAIAAAKPSDVYDGAGFYHSGVFNLGPPGQAPTSFELTFPSAGSFSYLCVLHWDIGHMGTVIVQQ